MRKSLHYNRLFKICWLIADLILLNISFNVAHYFQFGEGVEFTLFYQSIFVIFNLGWVVTALYSTTYRVNRFSRPRNILANIFYAVVLHLLLINVIELVLKGEVIPVGFIVITYSMFMFLVSVSRIIYFIANKKYNKLDISYKKYVIVGGGKAGKALYDFFEENQSLGFKCMGIFDNEITNNQLPKHLLRGSLEALKAYCKDEHIEEIYFTLPLTQTNLIKEIAEFADDNFIYFRISPDFSELMQRNMNIDFYGNIPVISVRNEPLGITVNRIIKRAFDIVFSLGVICFLFPFIFPIIALIIKLESPGPVFFKQLRPGLKNQLFFCFKFRTMRVNNETEKQATKNDSRVTRFGQFLRKNSLDELPQFFNVLLGDMSVVGPRPNMVSQLESYSKTIEKYALRHFVSPGITGYAQVKGYRGETQQLDLMKKRVKLDVKYMENWSFTLDIIIILKTIKNIFRGEKNAY